MRLFVCVQMCVSFCVCTDVWVGDVGGVCVCGSALCVGEEYKSDVFE